MEGREPTHKGRRSSFGPMWTSRTQVGRAEGPGELGGEAT